MRQLGWGIQTENTDGRTRVFLNSCGAQRAAVGVTREARQGLIEGQSAVRGCTAPVSVRWRGEMEPYPWAMAAILASLRIILGIPSLSPLLDHLLHGSHICLFLSGPPSF